MKLNTKFNETPLIEAARKGKLEIVRELLTHDEIDINFKNI